MMGLRPADLWSAQTLQTYGKKLLSTRNPNCFAQHGVFGKGYQFGGLGKLGAFSALF